MLRAVCPYALRGFLYYQGEEDCGNYYLHYGEQVVAEGPSLAYVEQRENTRCLTFDNTAGGLTVRGDLAEGFEVAGSDGVYHPARAEVSLDTVRVWSDQVPRPETVRYAWKNYTYGNLYNLAGMPAVPVRTDQFSIYSKRH